MAISFVGSNTQSVYGIGISINLTLPASLPGDLVLVFTGCPDESQGGPPSTAGYTAITNLLHATDNCRLHASYKFMGSTPDSNVSVLSGTPSTSMVTLALVFRGVHAAPLDVAVTTSTSGINIVTAPAITPARDDCCIVIAAAAQVQDTAVGAVSGYLPSPSVQDTNTTAPLSVAAAYRVLSGQASVSQAPGQWSTWVTGVTTKFVAVTIALRAVTTSTDINTVDRATITSAGKAIVGRELVAVSKATVGYLGKTIGIPDSSVEAIFIDKYRMVITGKSVELIDINRAVTVSSAAVLYRGRIVTPREIMFEDVPRYRVKGRGSGHWMETR